MRNAYKILVGKPEGKNHLEDLGIGGRIVLKQISEKYSVRCGLDASGSGQGLVVGCCKHSNKPWDLIKGEEFPD
jgi:hypothetical protein